MEKNDLEQQLKERFKDFKETPNEKVWKDIEASLDKKKKKRLIPLWWYWGGAAALFAFLLYVINPFDGGQSTTQSITNVQQENVPSATPQQNSGDNDNILKQESFGVKEQLVDKTNGEVSKDMNETTSKSINVNRNTLTSPSKAVNNLNVLADNNANKAVETNSALAKSSIKNEDVMAITIPSSKEDTFLNEQQGLKNEALLNNKTTQEEAVVQVADKDGKQSIFDVIAEQDEEVDESIEENEKSTGKWTMGPAVAPVYFAALGEGSPIHSNFAGNSKSGNINLSYGLTVSYQMGKKLSVRSGIHKVDFGYDTEDVLFSSSLQASTNQLIDNINYSQTSRNLVVQSKAKANVLAQDASSTEVLAANPALDGRMVQQLGYVEVPFELNYAILDAKFGLNLIGGLSSLFLIDNAVSLESNGLITEMGEANNVNDLNFSTNIGLGLNYQFTPKLQLSMEPIFKYQLNTFSETAGDFRPYSVGVYSGVRYKF